MGVRRHNFPVSPVHWRPPAGWGVLLVGVMANLLDAETVAALPTAVCARTDAQLAAAGVSYVDVLACADVVVGKVGTRGTTGCGEQLVASTSCADLSDPCDGACRRA